MDKFKLDSYDVKDKIVLISDADLTEESMAHLATQIKKSGAIEVIFAYGGVELKLLSDKDLENIGLCRLSKKKKPKAKKSNVLC